jgi:hypothetical protein
MAREPLERRFRSSLREGNERRPGLGACAEWCGTKTSAGYGTIRDGGKPIYAHRYAWFLATGAWPTGVILHRCDNPGCVRVDHLRDGTQLDNMRDMVSKDRQARGERNGHAKLTADDARAVRILRILGLTSQAISTRLGMTAGSIRSIWNGANWRHCYQFAANGNVPSRYHGLSNLPEYHAWQSMRSHHATSVCARWGSAIAFIEDVGPRPSRLHEFTREHQAQGFWCGKCRECVAAGRATNCSWVKRKKHDFLTETVVAWGEAKPLAEWCDLKKLSRYAVTQRLQNGWTPERALSTPVRARATTKRAASVPRGTPSPLVPEVRARIIELSGRGLSERRISSELSLSRRWIRMALGKSQEAA